MAKEKEHTTIFRYRAIKYQNDQQRTKKTATMFFLKIFGIGVLLSAFSSIYFYLNMERLISIGRREGTFGFEGYILGITMLVGYCGLSMGGSVLIYIFLRPTKLVVCPNCNSVYRIFKKERKYMCTNCWALLLVGKRARLMPKFSECSYCGLRSAISDDHGRFLCPNCGIIRESIGGPNIRFYDKLIDSIQKRLFGGSTEKTKTCSVCQQVLPGTTLYCRFCDTILVTEFTKPVEVRPRLAYDEDWKIGKNAIGHFYFARALLKAIQKGINDADDITKIQPLLKMMFDALISLEEALQDARVRPPVEKLLTEVDLTYAALLDSELQAIRKIFPDKRFVSNALDTLADEDHIFARGRVEEILADSLELSGSIGRWNRDIVKVKREENYSQILVYDGLREESIRFTKWKEKL